MIAHFKNDNKIIVTGADRAEALLVGNLVAGAKDASKELTITEFYDIDGDVNGFALELKDKVVEEVPETEGE